MENAGIERDEARIVICKGASDKVFENYVFVPINDLGYITIKHVLKIQDVAYKERLKIPEVSSPEIFFETRKAVGVRGALTHLLKV